MARWERLTVPDEDAKTRWLSSNPVDRLRLARDDLGAGGIAAVLGEAGGREYADLARRLGGDHLSVDAPPNMVFVPGVMGSLLSSRTRGGIWWLDARTRRMIDRLGLSPDGRHDAVKSDDVGPVTTDPSYDAFMCAALEQPDLGHAIFPYDWRKSPRESAAALRDLVTGMHARNGGRPVHLVAHSMGGLVVRTALMIHGDVLWPLVGRIAFLGTPQYGSPAISGYLKNHLRGFDAMALLGRYLSRGTFRSLHGVLTMLPAPTGIYPGTRTADRTDGRPDRDGFREHPCANFEMYEADAWGLDLDSRGARDLREVLGAAAALHRDLHDAHGRLVEEQRERMLTIVGVGFRTLFRLELGPGLAGLRERSRSFLDRVEGDPHREGDGRVPVASALLEGVEARYVRSEHGGMPNVPAIHADVFRFLQGRRMQLPQTPAGAFGDHLADGDVSLTPALDGSRRVLASTDDPGYHGFDEPSPERLDQLDRDLETGALPEFERIRLL